MTNSCPVSCLCCGSQHWGQLVLLHFWLFSSTHSLHAILCQHLQILVNYYRKYENMMSLLILVWNYFPIIILGHKAESDEKRINIVLRFHLFILCWVEQLEKQFSLSTAWMLGSSVLANGRFTLWAVLSVQAEHFWAVSVIGNGTWASTSTIFKIKNSSWYCFLISEAEQTNRQQQQTLNPRTLTTWPLVPS